MNVNKGFINVGSSVYTFCNMMWSWHLLFVIKLLFALGNILWRRHSFSFSLAWILCASNATAPLFLRRPCGLCQCWPLSWPSTAGWSRKWRGWPAGSTPPTGLGLPSLAAAYLLCLLSSVVSLYTNIYLLYMLFTAVYRCCLFKDNNIRWCRKCRGYFLCQYSR